MSRQVGPTKRSTGPASAISYLDTETDHAGHAHAHFLLGVGRLRHGGSQLEQAERDLAEAVRLAQQHGAPGLGMARFELANARAERGDLRGAVALYAETARLAREARDPNQEVLALNNLAYHLMLLGETAEAEERIDAALQLSDAFGLTMACEYLYSTRGEILIAEGRWDEAEEWVNLSLAESKLRNNVAHVAKCRANLGRIAQGRGDLDSALLLSKRPRRSPRRSSPGSRSRRSTCGWPKSTWPAGSARRPPRCSAERKPGLPGATTAS